MLNEKLADWKDRERQMTQDRDMYSKLINDEKSGLQKKLKQIEEDMIRLKKDKDKYMRMEVELRADRDTSAPGMHHYGDSTTKRID